MPNRTPGERTPDLTSPQLTSNPPPPTPDLTPRRRTSTPAARTSDGTSREGTAATRTSEITPRRRAVLGGALGGAALLALPGPPAAASTIPAVAGSPLTSSARAASTVDELRLRWEMLLTGGPSVDPTDPDLAVAIARVDRAAQSALTTLDRSANRTFIWPDLASPTLSNHVASNFRRIKQLAVAWATNGSAYQGNTSVADDIRGALEWMHTNRYSPTLPRYDNDYDWEIGGASAFADTLVLLYDAIPAAVRTTYTQAINCYTPDPNLWRADRQIATGANRVWIATVVAIRAILDGDTAALVRVRDALSDTEGAGANSVLAFNDAPGRVDGTGEGFYSDGSFLQHYKHPYNGGYGKELVGTLSSLLYLLGGTEWTVTDPDLENIYHWIDDAFDPLMVRGDLMGSVCGREIARPSKQNHAPTQTIIEGTLRLIPAAPAARAAQLTALVKQWITEDTFRDFLKVTDPAPLVAARTILASSAPARGALVVHKQYPLMDKAAHHRPGFTIGLSAYSSRIYNYESIQNENLHGWHLSDGMVLLYDDDLGHYSGDYWPTVDPYRLPGTTVDTRRLADSYGFRSTSAADWVGGAAVPGRTIGAYGMDLRGYGTNLRALKSWFLIDDVMVCVGSDITGEGTVETIVENRKLRTGNETFTAAPGWCHLEGTGGYIFPDRTPVQSLRENRTATWREINLKYGTDDPITRPYQTVWYAHGAAPVGQGYYYVQLPTATLDQTKSYANKLPVQKLRSDSTAHAIRLNDVLAANFWTTGTVAELTTDGPASVVSVGGVVTISDPTQTRTSITVDLDKPGLSPVTTSLTAGLRVSRRGRGWRIVVDTTDRHGHSAVVRFR
ncbi:polysaccharide lyase 8 family protein [Kribbella solani]|uniref:polysaccharide lyase 8 family protein n=1 Tax=Kribbella solani TaxID=236067 RepID=UPI0029BB453A|nr:polysaccharide lyase 8 family protein [Kribbella solani]MDX3000889.1 polysaccharide lyase 8 family protein [Kribbella solani]